MSLRCSVKESKAASMADVSVLPSTTRKFFCESGGLVTCCACRSSAQSAHVCEGIAPRGRRNIACSMVPSWRREEELNLRQYRPAGGR